MKKILLGICGVLMMSAAVLFFTQGQKDDMPPPRGQNTSIIVSAPDTASSAEEKSETTAENEDAAASLDYAPDIITFSMSNEDGTAPQLVSDCYHLTGDTMLWVELTAAYDRVDFVTQPVSGQSSQLQQVIGSVRSNGSSNTASMVWEHQRPFQGYVWAMAYRGSVATRTQQLYVSYQPTDRNP